MLLPGISKSGEISLERPALGSHAHNLKWKCVPSTLLCLLLYGSLSLGTLPSLPPSAVASLVACWSILASEQHLKLHCHQYCIFAFSHHITTRAKVQVSPFRAICGLQSDCRSIKLHQSVQSDIHSYNNFLPWRRGSVSHPATFPLTHPRQDKQDDAWFSNYSICFLLKASVTFSRPSHLTRFLSILDNHFGKY